MSFQDFIGLSRGPIAKDSRNYTVFPKFPQVLTALLTFDISRYKTETQMQIEYIYKRSYCHYYYFHSKTTWQSIKINRQTTAVTLSKSSPGDLQSTHNRRNRICVTVLGNRSTVVLVSFLYRHDPTHTVCCRPKDSLTNY